LVIILVVVAGSFIFFFFRMGISDTNALADFPVDYKNYDQAISNFYKAVLASNPENVSNTSNLEYKVDETLNLLNAQASVRISSLTKNDGDIMEVSLKIADLARKEFDTLKTYRSAVVDKTNDIDKLANDFSDLRNQRQVAYAHYLELIELDN
ncbi:MAG TPA: hypothetical protein VF831_02315, partial [Anaerolineales bacterium]